MKKVVLLVAVALGLGATQINAQSVSGGVKADANLSNFRAACKSTQVTRLACSIR